MTWRTIKTEHFRITFHQGLENVADEFAREVEPIYDTMTEEVRWTPRRRTEVVLVDRTDFANGYATSVPYNAIVIYVTAPQEDSNLSLYDDWSTAIMTHEFTHILHLDSNHGIVRLARSVVGRIASTNDVSPWWMIEGFATFQETRHSDGGRGRAPLADMIKRTAVIEGAFPPLGNLDGLQPKPPSGNLRYLFGQDFIQFVADEVGEDAWTKWVHTYGSWVPYWLPTKRVFGRSLRKLYKEWRTHLQERYAAQLEPVEALGVTPTRLISDSDASCSAPRFSPDGNWLVWSCRDLRTGSAIWRSDGQGFAPEKLAQDRGAKNFTWRSDSKAFVYAGAHTVNRFNTWSDIYLFNVDSKRTKALTNGARARDPDFSPDGTRLVTVTNRAELNQLELSTVDGRREKLTTAEDHTQFSTPRHSPDGKVLAVSQWSDGRRDLWIYSLDGKPLRRLTSDRTADRDPVWSHDGRWLYFSSDRTGIPNIFAIEVETERLYQVTNLRTGATKPDPSPDGKLMAFQVYSQDGWDVHIADLDRESFIDHGPLPTSMRFSEKLADLVDPVEPPKAKPAKQTAKVKRLRHRNPFNIQRAAACSAWKTFEFTTPGVPAPRSFRTSCLNQSPEESTDNFDMTDVDDAFGEEEEIDWTIEPQRYNPLPTLLPRYALPFVQTTPFAPRAPFDFIPWGLQGTLTSSASDMLKHFAWSGSLSYRTDAAALSGGFALTLNRYLPVYSIGASSSVIPASRVVLFDPALPEPGLISTERVYWERRTTLFASVSYPYRPRTSIFANYQLSWRNSHDELPDATYLPLVPIRGRVGTLSGGWRYSWGQPTSYAISNEDGRIFSFIGSLTHPWLGTSVQEFSNDPNLADGTGKLTVVQLTSELREYITNPFIPNHVLAAKLGGGYTIGANQFLGNYQLGGNIGDGAFISTPDNSRMLRGYAFASDIGDRYWLASAEYRFPIWQVQRGWDTLPVYWRNISGAFFVDAGNAFGDVTDWQDPFDGSLVGVGAEVSTRWAFGWGAFVTARLGYGIGLTPVSESPERQRTFRDPRALYFQLGGSF